MSSILNEMPRTIAFIMGAVHGLNGVLVAAISWHVLRPRERWTRVALRAAAALIGISGAGFVSLIGTTSNDLVNSIFILGALLGILHIAASPSERPAWRGFAWSGLSAGVGLGLKYTAAAYVPGLAVVALLTAVRRRTPVGIVVFGACAVLGFMALAGHHLFTLWRDFGNPMFPMLNNIFKSPYFELESGMQGEFQARDFWQLIAYPFYWVKTNSYVVAELPLRDWRAAMAYLAIIAALVTRVAGLAGKEPRGNAGGETCGLGLVFIFVTMSYFAWAYVFGNYRYAVTLEMLTGVIVMGAVIWVARGRALRIASAIVLLTIAAATTVYPDWGRGRYSERYVDVRVPPLPANSVVLIATRQPVAFFIPYAEPTAQFLGIENDFLELSQENRLVSKVRSVMRTQGRPKFIVSVGAFDSGKLDGVLAQFDLALGPSPCQPIRSNLENPALSICPAVPRQPK
jgi:Glycosyltransferase family 87